MIHATPTPSPVNAQPPVKQKPRPAPVRFTDWAAI
ncbi:hypothetical protein JDO7802_03144 [Jannaschia donghaensis]|uniref:Uncharacterized protein n=1 Tax=Jannaschia donghaensis TaxID=420998 RepID=A0A0M6YQ17_9RHOB|nr:hypothetical protein JDO7802_03144 [Jannaschia donghaensis]